MFPLRLKALLVLALACAALAPLRAAPAAQDPDWAAIVGGYPQPGTPLSREELAILHWLQDTRTPADLARVQAENEPGLDTFLGALQAPLDPSAYPATAALLRQARRDLKSVAAALKAQFDRARPVVVDPTLTPAMPPDGKPSFPSHHAALGALFAQLLSRLDPADQDGFGWEGRLIGDDRVMAGLHWPSDVLAGRRLGQAFASYWLAAPENQGLLDDAAWEFQGLGGR
jgi:acid phosphatase (class A)